MGCFLLFKFFQTFPNSKATPYFCNELENSVSKIFCVCRNKNVNE